MRPGRLAIDCVIPAAGLSSRMGSYKLLEQFGQHSLVSWAVHHAVSACRRVIVVLGHNADAVRAVLPHGDQLIVVTNTEYERGMLTSIARGAAEVQSDRFFVAPADMPFLRPDLFRAVAAAADNSDTGPLPVSEPVAWFPDYHGRSGHPVLISSSVVPALIETVSPSSSGRGTLGSMHAFLGGYATVTVPVDDDGSIVDIDTMDSLQRHSHRIREFEP